MSRVPRGYATSRVVLLAALAAGLVGCMAPGTKTGHLAVGGTLVDEGDNPLQDETVEFILPAAYGLGGLDPYFREPADYGHSDRRFSATTDPQGPFRYDLGRTMYHATMWFIPPLGMLPRRPPAPVLFVRVPRCGGEFYAVATGNGTFFASDATELPIWKAHLVGLEAYDVADESKASSTLGWLRLQQ